MTDNPNSTLVLCLFAMDRKLKFLLKLVQSLSPKQSKYPRFVTIGFSHYCEKARWALDLTTFPYHEESHLPPFHLSKTLLELSHYSKTKASYYGYAKFQDLTTINNEKKLKEKTSVPKLILKNVADNKIQVISDGSIGILQYADYHSKNSSSEAFCSKIVDLYPLEKNVAEKISKLETYFNEELGLAATHWIFGNLLLTGSQFHSPESTAVTPEDNNAALDLFFKTCLSAPNVNLIEKILFRILGRKFILPLMIKNNKITSFSRDEAMLKIRKIFHTADVLLIENQKAGYKFLLPTSLPSAADITFAALCMPILFPSQASHLFLTLKSITALSDTSEGCRRISELAIELRSTSPSAQHALAMYRDYRHVPNS